jgi:hypothetical protein
VTKYIFPLDSNSQGNHNGYRSCYVARLILENKAINKKKKKRKIKKKKKKNPKTYPTWALQQVVSHGGYLRTDLYG